MLHSLHIKNFRLFRDLEIKSLNRVNLIAGKNNTGKTALLEALYLLFVDTKMAFDFPSTLRNCGRTSDEFRSFWSWLSYQKDILAKNEIRAFDQEFDEPWQSYAVKWQSVNADDPTCGITFNYFLNDEDIGIDFNVGSGGSRSQPSFITKRPKASIFSTHSSPPSEDAELFNLLVIKRKKKKLIELLKAIEPQLSDLQYLKVGSEPLVYAELPLPELIPITQLGQGFIRLFRFYSEMLLAEAQIILIDEIENGLHYSVLEEVWRGIDEIAHKEDLQVFATTHSLECIQAAHKVFKELGSDDFALHRLQRVKGEIHVVTHNQEMIDVASESDLEIR